MTTFDSTNASLNDLLREIKEGKIQLPDFQRGWVWDDDHIRDLLVSIARSFPIGAMMLLEAGGEVRFQTRPIEGLEDKIPKNRAPEKLILDGQQRLTTLTQALALDEPVRTSTAKGKKIRRHYYFDNKTPISCKANRKVGGEAPSCYLPRIQSEKQVQLDNVAMDALLASHALSPDLLRRDAFDDFLEDRRRRLSRLVETAIGKPVVQVSEGGDYGEPDE